MAYQIMVPLEEAYQPLTDARVVQCRACEATFDLTNPIRAERWMEHVAFAQEQAAAGRLEGAKWEAAWVGGSFPMRWGDLGGRVFTITGIQAPQAVCRSVRPVNEFVLDHTFPKIVWDYNDYPDLSGGTRSLECRYYSHFLDRDGAISHRFDDRVERHLKEWLDSGLHYEDWYKEWSKKGPR